jgi:HlyD family secretion protein
VLSIVTVVALGAGACTGDSNDIQVGTVARADVTEIVDAPAAVTAKAVTTLSAAADGTLAALLVTPGATVSAGQVMATIDSPTAQRQLDQAAQALRALSGGGGAGRRDLSGTQRRTDAAAAVAFAQAREVANKIADPALRTALLAQIDAAERVYREAADSARALIAGVQRGLASVSQAMSALTTAQRAQAQAAYDLASSTVDALTLRAPFAGVVQLGGVGTGSTGGSLSDLLGAASAAGVPGGAAGAGGAGGLGGTGGAGAPTGPGIDSAVAVGARVGAGTPVLTVVDTSELGLVAEVDETDVLLVTPGVTAKVELDAAPGARYDAAVRSVDVLPTASARGGVSYRVRLSLGAGAYGAGRAAPAPRPGMSAVAHLAVRSAPAAVVVPAAAVFTVDGHDTVWLVRDGKAQRVPVTVGVAGPDLVQVTSGVATGDRVVVRGTDRVRPGQDLR